MNIGTIPKISSIVLILLAIFILNLAGVSLMIPYLTSAFGFEEYSQYSMAVKLAILITNTLGKLLDIVLAIWVYREAKKQNEKPMIWALFTLFFGLIAIVLFYLFIIIKELKIVNQRFDKPGN